MPIGGAIFSDVLNKGSLADLPDVTSFAERSQGLGISSDVAAQWRTQIADRFLGAAKMSLAANVVGVGIPLTEIRQISGAAVGVFDAISKAVGGDSVASRIGTAIDEATLGLDLAEDAIGAATSVASAVPVIGAVVKLVFGFVSMVRQQVDAVRALREANKPHGAWTTFLPDADDLMLRVRVVPRLETADWSTVWSPPAWEALKFIATVLPSGVRYAHDKSVDKSGGGVGGVAGTDVLHRGWELWDIGQREPTVFETGANLPTVGNQATWLWGRIGSNTPAIFAVDAIACQAQWIAYLTAARDQMSVLSERHRTAIIFAGRRQFGWNTSLKPDTSEIGKRYGIQYCTNVRAMRQLAKLQRWATGTITTAYLSEDMAAFASDPDLKALWKERRAALLQHPARLDIDLSSVPDPAYRSALLASGVPRFGGPSVLSSGSGNAPPRRTFLADIGSRPPFDPIVPSPSAVAVNPGRRPDDGQTGTASPVLWLAGLGLAGLAVASKRR